MDWLRRKRIKQIITYGWKDSAIIAKDSGKNRLKVFCDIIQCFHKFFVFSYQYKKNSLWKLDSQEYDSLASKLGKANLSHDRWVIENYENHKFLSKWTQKKWENTPKGSLKRKEAYTKFFNAGKDLHVQYNVEIRREHFIFGKISIGNNVILARNADIDYTGDITIEDNVNVSESVKILTHEHEIDFCQRDALRHGAINTPIVIRDNVGIGARAIIMPGVDEIGRGAMISTGAIVKKRVPPYAIVMGNPARVVGFRYPPAIIAEFEEENYPEEERIPLEVLEDNYKKYYLSKIAEIKSFLE